VSGSIAQLFNLDTRKGVSGQHHAPAAFTPGKDPVPTVQEAGWAPEPNSELRANECIIFTLE
jgi:hypothetical protein